MAKPRVACALCPGDPPARALSSARCEFPAAQGYLSYIFPVEPVRMDVPARPAGGDEALPMENDYQLVLMRHGESEGNKDNVFTGWRDVDLSREGVEEAKQAGRILLSAGFHFDLAYTSVLQRAIKTLWLTSEEMGRVWVPVNRNWRLNERHYGVLQGLNKDAAVEQFGNEQVKAWRKGYAARPPLVAVDSAEWMINDERYASLSRDLNPRAESLEDVLKRSLPVWSEDILPQIRAGKKVFVVAHGNTLRALAKHIEGISDSGVVDMRLPNASPRAYRFDSNMSLVEVRFLGA